MVEQKSDEEDRRSKEELLQLYQNVVSAFGSEKLQPISELYRCKPEDYFKDIRENHGNIMKPYVKDNNGSLKSAINGKLKGLFFSGRLLCGKPPTGSPFGDTMLLAPCNKLLAAEYELYVADLYCYPNAQHYLVLVVCKMGSSDVRYCEENLVKLDKTTNPFFRQVILPYIPVLTRNLQQGGSFFINGSLWVELMFTADIDITDYPCCSIDAKGLGITAPNKMADKACPICNLAPITNGCKKAFCNNLKRHGWCSYGDSCNFDHFFGDRTIDHRPWNWRCFAVRIFDVIYLLEEEQLWQARNQSLMTPHTYWDAAQFNPDVTPFIALAKKISDPSPTHRSMQYFPSEYHSKMRLLNFTREEFRKIEERLASNGESWHFWYNRLDSIKELPNTWKGEYATMLPHPATLSPAR